MFFRWEACGEAGEGVGRARGTPGEARRPRERPRTPPPSKDHPLQFPRFPEPPREEVIGISGRHRGAVYFTSCAEQLTALLRRFGETVIGFSDHEDLVGEVANTGAWHRRPTQARRRHIVYRRLV